MDPSWAAGLGRASASRWAAATEPQKAEALGRARGSRLGPSWAAGLGSASVPPSVPCTFHRCSDRPRGIPCWRGTVRPPRTVACCTSAGPAPPGSSCPRVPAPGSCTCAPARRRRSPCRRAPTRTPCSTGRGRRRFAACSRRRTGCRSRAPRCRPTPGCSLVCTQTAPCCRRRRSRTYRLTRIRCTRRCSRRRGPRNRIFLMRCRSHRRRRTRH